MSSFTNMVRAVLPQMVRVRALFAAFAFLICLFAAQSAQAQATFTVTRIDDRNTTCVSGVDCSLREAVNAANTATTNDTITFNIPAANCPMSVCTITLTLGELAVNDAATAGSLTITNSTGASNLLISGNNSSRVFFVNTGANLTINGVTITKGNGKGTLGSGSGGGIRINASNSTLTLTNSIVSGNTAAGSGGGINNSSGTLTLTNSTVSGNTATSSSGGGINNFRGTTTLTNSTVSGNMASNGGIYNSSFGTLTLTNSTVSGNTATGVVGGIFNQGGTTTLTNSTVSGNTAAGSGSGGGGILNVNNSATATLNLTSVTVTQNSSTNAGCTSCGGGIANFGGNANLKNTIVAGNTVASASSSPDFSGGVAAGSSYNLIGNGGGTTGITNADANSNQVGVDPKLDPTLQLNGGTTPNHALLAGSPAIDKGNSFTLMNDQRGFTRPVDNPSIAPATNGDNADIGAFEVQPAAVTAASVTISGRAQTSTGRGIRNVLIRLTDGEGHTRIAYTTTFGYYRFADVNAGETYVITAKGKRYEFAQPTQVLNLNEDAIDVNFVAY